jgi:LPS-assembly protein
LALAGAGVRAAPIGVPFGPGAGGAREDAPIDVRAERTEYDQANQTVRASGNVVVVRGDETLSADRAFVNLETRDVSARGHIVYQRGAVRWEGEELQYNFRTGAWRTGWFTAYLDPFHVGASEAQSTNRAGFVLHNAVLTTCDRPDPDYHYALTCRRVHIVPGEYLTTAGTVVYLGPVPVMWMPWWYRSLGDRTVGFSADVGYRNRMGAYLLGTVNYHPIPDIRGATHLDLRSQRGAALGQDVSWTVQNDGGDGRLSLYAADDLEAENESATDPVRAGQLERARYRARFYHEERFTDRDALRVDTSYLSDPFVVEDFFEGEHRARSVPENYASFVHRGDRFTATAFAQKRWNDFYTMVERLPELAFESPRQDVPAIPGLYYEGASSLAWLQKLWAAEPAAPADYDALRLDTFHRALYPTRSFGFLNVIPQAALRLTYYSDTRTQQLVDEVATLTVTNLVPGPGGGLVPEVTTATVTNSVLQETPAGSGLRGLPEAGVEVSFRAFGVWTEAETMWGRGLRHAVEPYAVYRLVRNTGVEPDELPQFDTIDTLGDENAVQFGVRNRLQTRRDGGVRDLVNLDTYTTYRFESDEEDALDDLVLDLELRLSDRFPVDLDGALDANDGVMQWLDVRGEAVLNPWRLGLEYNVRRDESRLVGLRAVCQLNPAWALEGFARYDLESSWLQEHGYSVVHTLDCLGMRFGLSHFPAHTFEDGTEDGDDFRANFSLWLTAFPNVRLGSSRRN